MDSVSEARDRRLPLAGVWDLTWTEAGACARPRDLDALEVRWLPAPVPGTVAGALALATADGAVHRPVPDERHIDRLDWWYRRSFQAPAALDGEEAVLSLEGIATVSEVFLNGRRLLASDSMFASHERDVGALLGDENEIVVCCRALAPLLAGRRRPRARWRTRLVAEGNLRFHRTMLLGRAPGFAPGPAVAGLWRPAAIERRRGLVLERPRMRARPDGRDGVLECSARVRALPGFELPDELTVAVASGGSTVTGTLAVDRVDARSGACSGAVTVPDAERWWPHTHGRPALYEVTIGGPDAVLHRARVGFRALESPGEVEADGLDLRVNDVPVFARGAVWAPPDLRAPHCDREALRDILARVAGAGMNMVRVHGTAAYESDAFYELCDELGILVWQDFMFANLDYPDGDPAFIAEVEREARAQLERLGHHPCLAVLCGSSEVAQQVAMLGLDRELAHGPLYRRLLPELVREAQVDAPYAPSAPCGPELPFRYDRGVANYFGVGAYLRPLSDARLSGVRFATECLAFANVPDDDALADLDTPGGLAVHHPGWKAGVARDAGEGWDFDDVRDHYLRLLLDVDPVALRWSDQERYLQLSRVVTGEVMADVFGEWRRGGSACRGALVLWLKDQRPGAGWGLLDHRGRPKAVMHHLRRALAPVAVWTTDEGLRGIDVHVANDRPTPQRAVLRVALYRDFAVRVDAAQEEITIEPHGYLRRSVAGLIGRFVDASWAYRFGPPAQDLVAVTLQGRDGAVISQAFRFPAGRPLSACTADELGLEAQLQPGPEGPPQLRVRSRRFAYGVRVEVPGFVAGDDWFGVEPGGERILELAPAEPGAGRDAPGGAGAAGALTALNLVGRVRIAPPG